MSPHDYLDRLERIARQAKQKGIRDVRAYTNQVIDTAGEILLDRELPPAIRTQVCRVAKTLLLRLADGAAAALEDLDHIRKQLPMRKHV